MPHNVAIPEFSVHQVMTEGIIVGSLNIATGVKVYAAALKYKLGEWIVFVEVCIDGHKPPFVSFVRMDKHPEVCKSYTTLYVVECCEDVLYFS